MLGPWNLDTGTYYALFYAFSGFLSVAPVITELFNHFMYDVAFTLAARVVL